jgi:hypothetical protein
MFFFLLFIYVKMEIKEKILMCLDHRIHVVNMMMSDEQVDVIENAHQADHGKSFIWII